MYLYKNQPEQSDLGKKSEYDPFYNPKKLFAIPREVKRKEINIDSEISLPFFGYDLWNHYEVSWLNPKGKPNVAIARISYSCSSPNIIESKSMKLYFNSLNNTKFDNINLVQNTIESDLSQSVRSKVEVELIPLINFNNEIIYPGFSGKCIDDLDLEFHEYVTNPNFLNNENYNVEQEILFSDLLKSNCLVTNQPDWGSIQIIYSGKKINEEGLLKYIVSFRNHNEFHEQCIERIFIDLMHHCKPQELTVIGRYTRRGGLDINPVRSTIENIKVENIRLCRQ